MHAKVCILLDAVVETVGAPRLREEHERDCLPEVVQLKAAGPDGVHDGRIVDDARWYFERPSPNYYVRMCRGPTTRQL